MCGSDNEPGSHDPDVVASLKELARKGSGKHRIACDGVASEFAGRFDRQLCRNGACMAREVVPVSDGAAWITNVADELLAGMKKTYILDVAHAGIRLCGPQGAGQVR